VSTIHRLTARWLLAGLFVASLPLVNPYLRGDGNGYYAYVRSVVIDGDLDFENEFRHGDPLFREVFFDDQGAVQPWMRASTGRLTNQWAVGPSMLWLPFFLVAHGVVHVLNAFGAAIPADGYSGPYRWSCAIGTACYGWLAVLLGFEIAVRLAGARAALVAALAIWWASALPVYMYFLPFHVHALSAFAVAAFVWYWLRVLPGPVDLRVDLKDRSDHRRGRHVPRRWLAWGALAGLMVDVYYLNALFALPAAVEIARPWPPDARRQRLAAGLLFLAGLLLTLTPHFAAKWVVHGSPLATGYRDAFFWATPRLWQVGFSAEHGLFSWTPVLLLALAGLVGLAWRDRRVGGGALAVFLLFYYAVASYQNWHGQSSFGNRFFLSFTALFVLGAAVAVEWSDRARLGRPLATLALVMLVAWNVGFMFQWGTNLVPNRGPVDFGAVARNQVTEVPQRLARFAWRYMRDRRGITSEVEERDRIEREDYRLKR
jgi:hypothetical protein